MGVELHNAYSLVAGVRVVYCSNGWVVVRVVCCSNDLLVVAVVYGSNGLKQVLVEAGEIVWAHSELVEVAEEDAS